MAKKMNSISVARWLLPECYFCLESGEKSTFRAKCQLFRAKYQSFEQKVKGFPQDVKVNLIICGKEASIGEHKNRKMSSNYFLYSKYEK